MEDNRVAKLFLSAITGLDIVTLTFLPQELSTEKKEDGKKARKKNIISALDLSIYRLDFSAQVKEANGTETVIILEIQKSKFANEGMRFRKYATQHLRPRQPNGKPPHYERTRNQFPRKIPPYHPPLTGSWPRKRCPRDHDN